MNHTVANLGIMCHLQERAQTSLVIICGVPWHPEYTVCCDPVGYGQWCVH